MLHFELYNNNNQYRLIFQSPPYQRLISLIVHTRVRTLVELTRVWYVSTKNPNKEETKYHTFLILLLFGCFMLFIRSIWFCMCYRHTYIHLVMKRVITWKLIIWWLIFIVGPVSVRDWLRSTCYCFWGLIITRPTRHFKNITIINMTSYRFPSVSPTPV